MFAQLGNIQFELITYFEGLNKTQSYKYATHERINQKPVLQYLGENLEEIAIKMNFHNSFCKPTEELQKLEDVASKGKALKFIKGNGEYVGIFVITEITSVIEQTSNEGDLQCIQLEIKLQEYTGKIEDEELQNDGLKKRWNITPI